jgi:hypothetical protein
MSQYWTSNYTAEPQEQKQQDTDKEQWNRRPRYKSINYKPLDFR